MPLLRYALVGVFAAFIFVPAFAGENTNKQLNQRIQELKTELASLKEIARLKREIAEVKKQLSGPEKIPQKVPAKTNAAAGKKVVDTPRPTPKLKPVDAFKALRKLEQSALPTPKLKSVDAVKALRKLEQSALPSPKPKSVDAFQALRKLERSALPTPKLKSVKLVPKPLAMEPKAKKFRTAALGKTHTVTNKFPKQASIKQRVAHSSFKKVMSDQKRWNVSMRALYLRQIDDTPVLHKQSPDDNDQNDITHLDARYGSGIEGQIAYRFPNSNWSASATGRHFSEETSRVFQSHKDKTLNIGVHKTNERAFAAARPTSLSFRPDIGHVV